MSARNEKRPWLAVVLAFVYPGLGHVYLREWLRALVWFFLVVTSSTLLLDGTAPEEFTVEAFLAAAEAIPVERALALLSITVFSMIDAYWMANQRNRESAVEAGTTCPNCGKDIDADLEFCHWCTEPLDGESN